jgi:hypothetical protein
MICRSDATALVVVFALLHDAAHDRQERGTIRMLTPDLALWQGGMTIQPPGGAPALKGYVVQLMKKVSGRWLVLEAHPKSGRQEGKPISSTTSSSSAQAHAGVARAR